MTQLKTSHETLLVIGGGISGMTAAIEAAETGKKVVLVEQRPFLGGRVTQFYKYFPKLCFPSCGLEINQRRARTHPNLSILTLAEVCKIEGTAGHYRAHIRLQPRYVNANCTACGECAKVVDTVFADPLNYGLERAGTAITHQRKGVYLPHPLAHPQRYVLDPRLLGTPEAERAQAACHYHAIDLTMQAEEIEITCGAVIFATGWQPYDATLIQPYGYGRVPNVITNVEFERLADPQGPTNGKLIRPSDGEPAKKIAFIQCAGSRDQNHLAHCSRICCMASLKQTTYALDAYGAAADIHIYYIDLRVIDRFEDFYNRVRAHANVRFIKSKVASITEDRNTHQPVLHGVDTEGYHRYAESYDLVVLAVGMQPSVNKDQWPAPLTVNACGFIEPAPENDGLFAAGVAADALDINRAVQHATGAALRAIQVLYRAAHEG